MDTEVAIDFLKELHHSTPGSQWINIFAIDRANGSKILEWCRVDEVDSLAQQLDALPTTCCVWFGVSTRRKHHRYGRGGDADCALTPALWLDIDVQGPGHKSSTGLPPTMDVAYALLDKYPFNPDAVVRSGGGLQAYWIFDQPLRAEEMQPMLARWKTTWDSYTGNYHLDNVFDLARVMRLPGSKNNKTFFEDGNAPEVTLQWAD